MADRREMDDSEEDDDYDESGDETEHSEGECDTEDLQKLQALLRKGLQSSAASAGGAVADAKSASKHKGKSRKSKEKRRESNHAKSGRKSRTKKAAKQATAAPGVAETATSLRDGGESSSAAAVKGIAAPDNSPPAETAVASAMNRSEPGRTNKQKKNEDGGERGAVAAGGERRAVATGEERRAVAAGEERRAVAAGEERRAVAAGEERRAVTAGEERRAVTAGGDKSTRTQQTSESSIAAKSESVGGDDRDSSATERECAAGAEQREAERSQSTASGSPFQDAERERTSVTASDAEREREASAAVDGTSQAQHVHHVSAAEEAYGSRDERTIAGESPRCRDSSTRAAVPSSAADDSADEEADRAASDTDSGKGTKDLRRFLPVGEAMQKNDIVGQFKGLSTAENEMLQKQVESRKAQERKFVAQKYINLGGGSVGRKGLAENLLQEIRETAAVRASDPSTTHKVRMIALSGSDRPIDIARAEKLHELMKEIRQTRCHEDQGNRRFVELKKETKVDMRNVHHLNSLKRSDEHNGDKGAFSRSFANFASSISPRGRSERRLSSSTSTSASSFPFVPSSFSATSSAASSPPSTPTKAPSPRRKYRSASQSSKTKPPFRRRKSCTDVPLDVIRAFEGKGLDKEESRKDSLAIAANELNRSQSLENRNDGMTDDSDADVEGGESTTSSTAATAD